MLIVRTKIVKSDSCVHVTLDSLEMDTSAQVHFILESIGTVCSLNNVSKSK